MTYCSTPATLRLETLNAAGAVTNTLNLMDETNGYRVSSLDVAFPTVRSATAALPTRDGDYDTTLLYGPRTVTIAGWYVPSSHGSRQKVMQALAWWCQPRLRPRLVYALDADCTVLWLGLRGADLSGPHSNPTVSQFQASWVAPDPVARTLSTSTVSINSGVSGTATNAGTYRAWPVLDIFGPATNPAVTWTSPASGQVVFTGLTIPSGHFVEVDTNAQTVLLDADPNQSRYQYLDFMNTRWTGLEPGATTLAYSGGGHVTVTWADSTI